MPIKSHVGYGASILLLIAVTALVVSGRDFGLYFAIILMPKFYVHYWFIVFSPFALGLALSLYKHKFRFAILGLILTIPMSLLCSLYFLNFLWIP